MSVQAKLRHSTLDISGKRSAFYAYLTPGHAELAPGASHMAFACFLLEQSCTP
jgi:hypothetical protein